MGRQDGAVECGVNWTIITHVPTNGKSKSIVDIAGTELRNGTRKRKPGSHFTQALHHGKNRDTSEGITKQNGQRTGTRESAADTQEETSTNSTSKSNELDVPGLQSGKVTL